MLGSRDQRPVFPKPSDDRSAERPAPFASPGARESLGAYEPENEVERMAEELAAWLRGGRQVTNERGGTVP
jgi:hypothetical protein